MSIVFSGLVLAAAILVMGTSCGTIEKTPSGTTERASRGTAITNTAQANDMRAKALAALAKAAAWQLETTSSDGWAETEWWSAGSADYRCDESFNGKTRSSMATDGKVVTAPGPDGVVINQPLGAAAGHLPNSTVFTEYYSYLKQGRPVSVELYPDGTINLVLTNAPSSLTAQLSADSYLPLAFLAQSEETGAVGTHSIQMSAISLDALKQAVQAEITQVANRPPPTYPDVTPKDHLLNALRAAGFDCYRADTYPDSEKGTSLELSIQVSPGQANDAEAQKAVPIVREFADVLPLDAVTVYLLSTANEFYSETFILK
jgi:hypothetical protein